MRTFVAIEVNNNNVLNSIHQIQSELNIKAKPVELHNMHFTVLFLGEVSEEMVRKISDALNGIEFSTFSITFTGIGAFPKPNSPRIIWIGVNDGINELENLAETMRAKLADLGFNPDKKFKPHLTVFRVKKRIESVSSIMKDFETMEFGTETISQIKLKKSVLSPKGPEYSDLLEVNAK